ncbi:hypothetical protein K438DRAFT_1837001, partial [Mycena galopus ATCC 62051]
MWCTPIPALHPFLEYACTRIAPLPRICLHLHRTLPRMCMPALAPYPLPQICLHLHCTPSSNMHAPALHLHH